MPGDTNDTTDIYVRRISDVHDVPSKVCPPSTARSGGRRQPDIPRSRPTERSSPSRRTRRTSPPSTTTRASDVYVRQMTRRRALMELVSKAPAAADALRRGPGTCGADPSRILGPSSISADGRYVAFGSVGSDFVGGDDERGERRVRPRPRAARDDARQREPRRGARRNNDSGPASRAPPHLDQRRGARTAFESSAIRSLASSETSGELQVYVRAEDPPASENCGIEQAASTGERDSLEHRVRQPDVESRRHLLAQLRRRARALRHAGAGRQLRPADVDHASVGRGRSRHRPVLRVHAVRDRGPDARDSGGRAAAARASSRSRPSSPTTKP